MIRSTQHNTTYSYTTVYWNVPNQVPHTKGIANLCNMHKYVHVYNNHVCAFSLSTVVSIDRSIIRRIKNGRDVVTSCGVPVPPYSSVV